MPPLNRLPTPPHTSGPGRWDSASLEQAAHTSPYFRPDVSVLVSFQSSPFLHAIDWLEDYCPKPIFI